MLHFPINMEKETLYFQIFTLRSLFVLSWFWAPQTQFLCQQPAKIQLKFYLFTWNISGTVWNYLKTVTESATEYCPVNDRIRPLIVTLGVTVVSFNMPINNQMTRSKTIQRWMMGTVQTTGSVTQHSTSTWMSCFFTGSSASVDVENDHILRLSKQMSSITGNWNSFHLSFQCAHVLCLKFCFIN